MRKLPEKYEFLRISKLFLIPFTVENNKTVSNLLLKLECEINRVICYFRPEVAPRLRGSRERGSDAQVGRGVTARQGRPAASRSGKTQESLVRLRHVLRVLQVSPSYDTVHLVISYSFKRDSGSVRLKKMTLENASILKSLQTAKFSLKRKYFWYCNTIIDHLFGRSLIIYHKQATYPSNFNHTDLRVSFQPSRLVRSYCWETKKYFASLTRS